MNVMVHGGALPGIKKLATILAQANRNVLIGVPAEAQHKDEETGEAKTMAEIAAIHEFGSPENNIPERPVLRQGVRNGAEKFHRVNMANLRAVLDGKMTVTGALEKLGVVAVGEVKREFVQPEPAFAPLKQSTIDERERKFGKKSTRPLVASGQYRQSITYIVEAEAPAGARII